MFTIQYSYYNCTLHRSKEHARTEQGKENTAEHMEHSRELRHTNMTEHREWN